MYPIGHPALMPAIESVIRRAEQAPGGPPADRVRRRAPAVDHRRRDDRSGSAGAAASRGRPCTAITSARSASCAAWRRRNWARRFMHSLPRPTGRATRPQATDRRELAARQIASAHVRWSGARWRASARRRRRRMPGSHRQVRNSGLAWRERRLASDGTEGSGRLRPTVRVARAIDENGPRRSLRPGHRRLPVADCAAS